MTLAYELKTNTHRVIAFVNEEKLLILTFSAFLNFLFNAVGRSVPTFISQKYKKLITIRQENYNFHIKTLTSPLP